MDSILLAVSFAAATAISACVVLVFSRAIDDVLSDLIPEGMKSAWSQGVKFALFTVTFAGGMRLTEVAALVSGKQASGRPAITAGEGLLEVFKTIAGSLAAAAGTLMAFFAASLAVYAALRAYQSFERRPERPRGTERPAQMTDRHAGSHPIRP